MDARLKETVRRRAGLRCEYCHLPEFIAELPFQFDHVIAEQHGGVATADNLAFACVRCNRYKGPNIAGHDPHSGKLIPLFHPRKDVWNEHFEFQGALIIGITAIGRVTVQVLAMNAEEPLRFRNQLIQEGAF